MPENKTQKNAIQIELKICLWFDCLEIMIHDLSADAFLVTYSYERKWFLNARKLIHFELFVCVFKSVRCLGLKFDDWDIMFLIVAVISYSQK